MTSTVTCLTKAAIARSQRRARIAAIAATRLRISTVADVICFDL